MRKIAVLLALILTAASIVGQQTLPDRKGRVWQPRPSPSASLSPSHLQRQRSHLGGSFSAFTNGPVDLPFDADLAIGLDRLVAITNDGVKLFDRSGTELDAAALGSFFSFAGRYPYASLPFDPVTRYDDVTQRYYFAAIEYNYSGSIPDGNDMDLLHVAISKNSAPSSLTSADWHIYLLDLSLSFTAGLRVPDFPSMLIDSGYITFGIEVFSFVPAPNYSILMFGDSSWSYSIPLAPALSGNGGVLDPDPDSFGIARQLHANAIGNGPMQPAAGAPSSSDDVYFVTAFTGSNDGLWITAVGNRALPSHLHPRFRLSVPHYDWPDGLAEQPGTNPIAGTGYVSTLDERFKRGAVFGEDLWTLHTIQLDGVEQTRWYRIDLNGWPDVTGGVPQLADWGTIQDGTATALMNTYYGDLDVDLDGNVAMVYTRSSSAPNEYISVARRVLLAGAGDFGPPVVLRTSATDIISANYPQAAPWGDYQRIDSDPVEPGFFWAHSGNVPPHPGGPSIWETWVDYFGIQDLELEWNGPIAGAQHTFLLNGPLSVSDPIYLYLSFTGKGDGPNYSAYGGLGLNLLLPFVQGSPLTFAAPPLVVTLHPSWAGRYAFAQVVHRLAISPDQWIKSNVATGLIQ